MVTRIVDATSTNPNEILSEAYRVLNKLDIGSSPEDPPVAFLIQPTGKFTEGEAELKITIFEGFKSNDEIGRELLDIDHVE